mgnify:CR=1 FL=1
MEEIHTAKRTCDDGIYRILSSRETNLGLSANKWEDVAFSQFNQGEFSIVRVSSEIWKTGQLLRPERFTSARAAASDERQAK